MTKGPEIPTGVFARGPARDPRVTQASSPWTLALGVVGLVALGVGVFSSLTHARTARLRDAPARYSDMAVVRPMTLTQADPVPTGDALPVFNTNGTPAPTNSVPLTSRPLVAGPDPYLTAPAVVVDLGDGNGPAPAAGVRIVQTPGAPVSPSSADAQQSADERFAARITSGVSDSARARQLRDLTRIVPQGATIPAVLETAIDSDLPGSVRAVVSRDVRSYDGSQVLIPRGSKLIGQYRSAAAVGQTRAFVIWSRLLTPSGISVDIGSPATDRLGRGGLDGDTDSHFFRRFGAAIMLSVLSAGLDAVTRGDGSSSNTLIIGSPVQASRVAEIALSKQIDIPVTIRVPQGQPVQVSLARDLDFSGVVLGR